MRRMIKSIFALLIATLAITSCEQDPAVESGDNTSDQTTVSVPITITIDAMEYGTEESRSDATRAETAEDNDGISSDVKTLWIAQLSGTEDTSIVLAAHYISDLSNIGTLDFIETIKSTTMVYLANVDQTDAGGEDDLISRGMTLAEIKALTYTLTAPTSADQLYTSGLVYVDSDGTAYFKMSGSEVLTSGLRETTTLNVSLKRNAVKITVNLTNNWVDSTITGITLMSAASETGYFLNRDDFDLTAEYPVIAEDDDDTYTTLDHETSVLSLDGDAGETSTISFYVPANMRGEVEDSTAETKPDNAPDYATYIVISAGDEDSGCNYTFYLGANLSTDYNLMPNYHYTYDIDFTGVGDVYGDPRITITFLAVDYSTLASSSNCYIINPSDDYGKRYYIPIEDRINTFWSSYATGSDSDYVGTKPLSTAATLDDWECEVLWYDNDTSPIAESSDNLSTSQIYIEEVIRNGMRCLAVSVPKGFNSYGNVLVAVKDKEDDPTILWSWHLWLTNYNPYENPVATDDATIFSVTGGELHRYHDTDDSDTPLWDNGGAYVGKYIMDRNIGALSNGSTITYAMFYQYGRKDPFIKSSSFPTTSGQTTFDVSVRNPTNFIISSSSSVDWCSEDIDTSYIWNDKMITDSNGKSIFDPSPYGFQVPITNTWSSISKDNIDTYYYNTQSGALDYESGAFDTSNSYEGDSSYIWSATQDSEDISYALEVLFGTFLHSGTSTGMWRYAKSYGFQIRCIQE